MLRSRRFAAVNQHTMSALSIQIGLLMIITASLLVCESRNVGKCIKDVHGSKCYQPKSNWQHDGICLRDKTTSRSSCHIPDTRQFKFSIAARLRQLKIIPGVKKVTNLWIRGSGPGLSWEKPLALQKSASALDKWKVDISYTYDSNALLCLSTSHCSLQQKALEFRVYRDELGKQDMLGPNFFVPLPISNSMAGALGFTPPEVMVYPWFDGTSTTVQQIRIPQGTTLTRNLMPKFNMILPPSFNFNARKTYPLVLLFGAPTITHILEHMYIYEASIKEAIVVAINYVDDAPFCAFNPFMEDMTAMTFESSKVWRCKGSSQQCHECQTCWDEQRIEKCEKDEFILQSTRCLQAVECFGRADNLLDLIELNLLSEIAKATQSRAQINFPRDRMSIIGFDGAGLLACYAALTRPYYYQHAACLSAPFHWPMPTLRDIGINRMRQGIGQVLREMNATLLTAPGLRLLHMTQRFYVDIGDLDNFFFPAVDPYENAQWFIQLLKDTLWLEDNKNVHFSIVPNGGNSYYHQRRGGMEVLNRLKVPLLFFFRAEGGPNRDFPRIAKVSDTAYHQQEQDLGISSKQIEASISEDNDTASQDTCDAFNRRWREPQDQSGVPIPVFLVTVGKHSLLTPELDYESKDTRL